MGDDSEEDHEVLVVFPMDRIIRKPDAKTSDWYCESIATIAERHMARQANKFWKQVQGDPDGLLRPMVQYRHNEIWRRALSGDKEWQLVRITAFKNVPEFVITEISILHSIGHQDVLVSIEDKTKLMTRQAYASNGWQWTYARRLPSHTTDVDWRTLKTLSYEEVSVPFLGVWKGRLETWVRNDEFISEPVFDEVDPR